MLTLEACLYTRTQPWSALCERGADAVVERLAAMTGAQIEAALGDIPRRDVGLNMVTSTMLDMPFTSGWLDWRAIAAAAARHTSSPPTNFVTAYECASWGYVLRYAMKSRPRAPYVVISVLDANILDYSFWRGNAMWGRSGFGLATFVIKLSADGYLRCNTSKSSNALGEFCVDLRGVMAERGDALVAAPWFSPHIASLYDRLLPSGRLLENLEATYGHSFGADPWIAMIEERARGRGAPQTPYLATSIALSGYWCFAEIALAERGRFAVLPEETLEAAA